MHVLLVVAVAAPLAPVVLHVQRLAVRVPHPQPVIGDDRRASHVEDLRVGAVGFVEPSEPGASAVVLILAVRGKMFSSKHPITPSAIGLIAKQEKPWLGMRCPYRPWGPAQETM
jgi:hypothetical protein